MSLALLNKCRSFQANPYKLFVKLSHYGFFHTMPDETYLKLLYRGILGRTLNLDSPVSYSEKVQWLKLYDKNPIYPKLCDKYTVRDYVRERAGDDCLIPLLGVWDSPEQIDFDNLPEQFVLKCTHDSGSVIICPNKSALDISDTRRKLRKWLGRDYSYLGREWPYHYVSHRVIAETFIGDEAGTSPDDYKFYCWQGKVFSVLLCVNRGKGGANYLFYDPDYVPCYRSIGGSIKGPDEFPLMKPPHFEEMKMLAEQLAKGLNHVRVDLYDTPQGVRFGEMTLYPNSGFNVGYTEEFNDYFGAFIDLEEAACKTGSDSHNSLFT